MVVRPPPAIAGRTCGTPIVAETIHRGRIELVVDRAHIGHLAIGVEHEGLRRGGRPKVATGLLRFVADIREIESPLGGPLLHLVEPVGFLPADADRHDLNALVGIVLLQLDEPLLVGRGIGQWLQMKTTTRTLASFQSAVLCGRSSTPGKSGPGRSRIPYRQGFVELTCPAWRRIEERDARNQSHQNRGVRVATRGPRGSISTGIESFGQSSRPRRRGISQFLM